MEEISHSNGTILVRIKGPDASKFNDWLRCAYRSIPNMTPHLASMNKYIERKNPI